MVGSVRIEWVMLMGGWLLLMNVSATSAQENDQIYGIGQDRGRIDNNELNEASGLAASVKNPGMLWSHNDSGDQARIFLMDGYAHIKAVFYLKGITGHDLEDMDCIQKDGENYLLIGDIGDNTSSLETIKVYLFKEPKLLKKQTYTDTIPLAMVITYVLRYEDGPRDAECLFYDPISQKLYIISKRELQVGLYETEFPIHSADTLLLKKRVSLPFTFITGGDISTDGREVLIKNLLEVYYWSRNINESIPEVLRKKATKLPYKVEAQGESIAFAHDGLGYYTVSEEPFGFQSSLIYYPRIE